MSIARTSWVAAAFIAAVTEASVHLPFLLASRSRFLSSRSTRPTEPLWPHSSSAAAKPVARGLVPVDDRAVRGVDALRMWPALVEEARPLVLAGAARSAGPGRRCSWRIGSRPLVYIGDVLVVDVERVERLRGLRGRLEERLRAVHLAVREPAVEELVERVLAVARALATRSRPARPSTVA